MSQDKQKQAVAAKALEYFEPGSVLGIGTGSTVNFLIDLIAPIKERFEGAVSSSKQSSERLAAAGIPVLDLNSVRDLPVYIDGADECDPHYQLIKGGGAALTQEKIVAAVAKKFICILDESKLVKTLGRFPLPIEVIPSSRSYVAREIVKLGGDPVYREGVVTDNGNVILDVHHLKIMEAVKLEETLNNITGVVCNGLFAKRRPDLVLVAGKKGVQALPETHG